MLRECSILSAPPLTSILLQFVMRHAPGARALKFVRRLPLFKGLGDNNLISVASRMREKVYQVRSLCIAAVTLQRKQQITIGNCSTAVGSGVMTIGSGSVACWQNFSTSCAESSSNAVCVPHAAATASCYLLSL